MYFVCIAYIVFFSFLSLRVCLFKGDEVIEWNGRSLQGKSTQEVCDIIDESRHESQIELIVSRPLSVNRIAAQTSWRQSHSPNRAQIRQYLYKGSQHHFSNPNQKNNNILSEILCESNYYQHYSPSLSLRFLSLFHLFFLLTSNHIIISHDFSKFTTLKS